MKYGWIQYSPSYQCYYY